jgi:hypothetical protein
VARLLPLLLAAACLIACTASPPPAPSPSPSPAPSSAATVAPVLVRPPADDILADADVGLPRIGGRDHLTLTQAASEQVNEPLALTNYRAWGWADAADRTWAGARRVDETLVLLTRTEGADLAFRGIAGELKILAPCPDGLGLEQCAEDGASLVGRVGRYVFRITAGKPEADRLAGVQAARIRR